MVWRYRAGNREVNFDVIARSEEDALLFVVQAVAKGKDSKGADLTWMNKIPWDETYAMRSPDEESETSKAERKALGEGYVEKR